MKKKSLSTVFLHRVNHLFYIANHNTEAERLRELNRIKINPESEVKQSQELNSLIAN